MYELMSDYNRHCSSTWLAKRANSEEKNLQEILSKIWSRRSRVVVHAMVAVSRMQFLVKRWNQCHLHCHWDQHLSHRLCHFHLHHCLCRDSERHHNKHHNCITTTWQSFQHHDRWILQLHNCICIVIFCGIYGKILQVEKVKEAWEEVWGAGKQSRGNFHHCHSHHHCHHDQRLTQVDSAVKERHETEEKSTPVPNLFQMRPKW